MTTILETHLPLAAEMMVKFYSNKANTKFVIDMDKSIANLKSEVAALRYIANLKMECTNIVCSDISVDMVHQFAIMRDNVRVETLTKILANILYFCKYNEVLFFDVLDRFGYDKIVEYVRKYATTVLKQAAFLNSIPLFLATSEGAAPDDDRSAKEYVKTVDENIHPEISVNLFNLFTQDLFLIHYLEYTTPISEQIYFKPHFEKNMYQGRSLFGWFGVPGNYYFALANHISESIKTPLGRLDLIELHNQLAEGVQDKSITTVMQEAIAEKGGLYNFVGMTHKDIATKNKLDRKAKKRSKRELRA